MRSHARLLNGRYRIDATIGEGAMGTVVRGEDELLRRPVAIKLLRPAFAADDGLVARFYAEARAAAGVVDPHVVAVHDVVNDGIAHAIVMELVDGPSLATILAKERKLDEATALRYARDVAEALGAAHARGMLHRDVKPANLLRTPDDRIKVTDFGLAKAIETDIALTEPGRLVGSAAYFSPEQAQGLALTPASDLYSLGVVLHQMLTGRLPFDGVSAVAVAVAHVTSAPPTLGTLAREMRPETARVVHRLLEKDPAARYDSAAALIDALDAVGAVPRERRVWEAPTLLGAAVVPPRRPRAARAASVDTAAVRRAALGYVRRPAAQLAAGIAALVLLLVTGAVGTSHRHAAAALAPRAPARAPASATVTVPDLTGAALGTATQAMQQANLRPRFAAKISAAPANTVIAQQPAPGARVRAGSTALVIISAGRRPHVVWRHGRGFYRAAGDAEGDGD